MCRYRKSIYLCNHSQLAAEPLQICSKQREYTSGLVSEPCQIRLTHLCSTIRVPLLCERCHAKQIPLDQKFATVKEKMSELRRHLEVAYDDCMKHVDEAGLKSEAKPTPVIKRQQKIKVDDKELDPVTQFLKMKMREKYSELMMLGNAYSV
ncbi:hypothetical protein GGR50DRAFT_390367 [Xylaria sp. CBS 124048]|nr:hypothetical protein GGR50DRAFT_390367 [Xylaria sp. CBS 124048]